MRMVTWVGTALLLLTGCSESAVAPLSPSGEDPSTASPTTSARSPEISASPSLVGTAEPAWQMSWSEVPFPGNAHSVLVDGDRLIVVGRDGGGLAAWISTDGVSWQRQSVPDPTVDTPIPDGWGMGPIVRLGDTLYSFGTLQGGGDFRRPVGWRSSDGANWEFIESSSQFFQFGGLTDVIASDVALLAVTEGGLIAPYQTAWRWTADTSWTATDLASRSDQTLLIYDVVWNDETYVAVGARYDPQDAQRWHESLEPGLWRSTDGHSWTPVALAAGMRSGCGVLSAMAAGGFLLIGLGPDGPISWSSEDGSAWSAVAPIGDTTDEACWDGLAAVNGGFLALRNTGDGLVLSASRDATSWSESELPDLRASDTLVAVLGEQVLVFAHPTSGEGATVLLLGTID